MADNYGIYDTETTGLFGKGWSLSDPRNPHIVQLALLVVDRKGNDIAVMDRIIKPEFYTSIDAKAVESHGITFERAMDEGMPFEQVVEEFDALMELCSDRVAHNDAFDARLMEIDYYARKRDLSAFRGKKKHCTMLMSKPIVRMPPTDNMLKYGFTGYKPPKLIEAYMHFNNGVGFEGAHNALNDVRAVKNIFFKMIGSDQQIPS